MTETTPLTDTLPVRRRQGWFGPGSVPWLMGHDLRIAGLGIELYRHLRLNLISGRSPYRSAIRSR